jgi:hypothetical protein
MWMWGNEPYDRREVYMFTSTAENFLAGDRSQRLRLCHTGHGINSWGISLEIVTDRLALFAQVGWGGVYGDQVRATKAVNRMLSNAAQLLTLVEGLGPTGHERLFVASSDFRGMQSSFVIDDQLLSGDHMRQELRQNRLHSTTPFSEAVDRLEERLFSDRWPALHVENANDADPMDADD